MADGTCKHHWVIDSPNGDPQSPGKCLLCGVKREFINSFTLCIKGGPTFNHAIPHHDEVELVFNVNKGIPREKGY